jgi:hypothetical protein
MAPGLFRGRAAVICDLAPARPSTSDKYREAPFGHHLDQPSGSQKSGLNDRRKIIPRLSHLSLVGNQGGLW